MSHGGFRKAPKTCQVLFEWSLRRKAKLEICRIEINFCFFTFSSSNSSSFSKAKKNNLFSFSFFFLRNPNCVFSLSCLLFFSRPRAVVFNLYFTRLTLHWQKNNLVERMATTYIKFRHWQHPKCFQGT